MERSRKEVRDILRYETNLSDEDIKELLKVYDK